MQIKVDIDNDDYYQKIGILTYSIPMDLTKYLKPEENNIETNNKNDKRIIFIIFGISIIIIIIFAIVFLIFYFKIKKKNDNLKEKILSISFSNEEKKDNLINDLFKEEDLNSTFI